MIFNQLINLHDFCSKLIRSNFLRITGWLCAINQLVDCKWILQILLVLLFLFRRQLWCSPSKKINPIQNKQSFLDLRPHPFSIRFKQINLSLSLTDRKLKGGLSYFVSTKNDPPHFENIPCCRNLFSGKIAANFNITSG